jgi:hypothetical protein
MPGPITSVSNTDVYWSDPPAERELHDRIVRDLDQRSGGPCADPSSVIGGALCGDDTAVSNACRRSQPGSVDEYLCDDSKLKQAQDRVSETTWDMLKSIIAAALLRNVK